MKERHDCGKEGGTYLTSGYRQDGEKWTCPVCGEVWVFCADEAEGGIWVVESVLEGE